MRARAIAALALASAVCGVHASADDRGAKAALPRHALAMEQELARIGVAARCAEEPNARYHCSWSRAGAGGDAPVALHAVCSDEADSIYVFAERIITLPSDHPRAHAVLRRLMELNWEMLVGKFEWSARTGEVRLSAVLNTDSNFDRRAFRSVLRALDVVAERYLAELRDALAE
jgi:hypothetical protein